MYALKQLENIVQNLACWSPEVKLHKAFSLVWSIYSVFCEWEVTRMLNIFKDNHTTASAASAADRHIKNSDWTICKFSLPTRNRLIFSSTREFDQRNVEGPSTTKSLQFTLLLWTYASQWCPITWKCASCKTEGHLERKQKCTGCHATSICIETSE